jgi:hypothetical protein
MHEKANARTLASRQIIESLDREFAQLHVNSCALIERTPTESLYAPPQATDPTALVSEVRQLPSLGECTLRSAAAIEQTFGGITSNLWDDPFEWTLPEYLSTPAKIRDHLAEVEATRQRAFKSFADDNCLLKQVAVPSGDTRLLIDLLLETLLRAANWQSRAAVVMQILFGISWPGFII